MNDEKNFSLILTAVKFAADKHRSQRRKGSAGSPYINHPIDVAESLWRVGGVRDSSVVVAAILHDTVEDTLTTGDEIERLFGGKIRSLVEEVSDDKSLVKEERKKVQNSKPRIGWISQFVIRFRGRAMKCSESNITNPLMRTSKESFGAASMSGRTFVSFQFG